MKGYKEYRVIKDYPGFPLSKGSTFGHRGNIYEWTERRLEERYEPVLCKMDLEELVDGGYLKVIYDSDNTLSLTSIKKDYERYGYLTDRQVEWLIDTLEKLTK